MLQTPQHNEACCEPMASESNPSLVLPRAFSVRRGRYVVLGSPAPPELQIQVPETAEVLDNVPLTGVGGSFAKKKSKSRSTSLPAAGGIAKKAPAEAAKKKSSNAQRAKPVGPAPSLRNVTVAHLIEAELIKAGDTVKVAHKGISAEGVLSKDGSVSSDGQTYKTCAEFSTIVKQRAQPNCRSDDGWRSCSVNGRSLHDYRTEITEAS